ncbi:LysR family transcriptional regulator, partial [Pseudomonas frederiksbergensis]|nr:LysR family transcriptional regulator [Pseudomonas frederiksbergensis]
NAWATWLHRSGESAKGSSRADYEHFYLCIQAAAAGLGVAMASRLMVQDEIDSGQLQAPRGFIQDQSAYYLLSPQAILDDDKSR